MTEVTEDANRLKQIEGALQWRHPLDWPQVHAVLGTTFRLLQAAYVLRPQETCCLVFAKQPPVGQTGFGKPATFQHRYYYATHIGLYINMSK